MKLRQLTLEVPYVLGSDDEPWERIRCTDSVIAARVVECWNFCGEADLTGKMIVDSTMFYVALGELKLALDSMPMPNRILSQLAIDALEGGVK